MSVYEFKCPSCKKVVELNTIEPPTCESCDVLMVRRYTLGGIAFKGKGFYRTDT